MDDRPTDEPTDRPTGRPNGGQNKTSKRTALKVETHYHIFEAAQERSAAAAIAVNDATAKKLKNKAWKKSTTTKHTYLQLTSSQKVPNGWTKKVESNREDIRGQPKSHCQKKGDIFSERIIQFGFWYSILIPFRADTAAHDGITLKSGKVVSELKRRPSHTKTRKKHSPMSTSMDFMDSVRECV